MEFLGIPATGSNTRSNTRAHGCIAVQHAPGSSRSTNGLPLTLQQGLGVLAGGVGLAAQHAGQFGDALFRGQEGDLGDGASRLHLLGGDVVRGGGRGDLRQVRDAEHLPLLRDLLHLLADGIGGLAADIGIHLVEHQHGDLVLGREHGLERQHHARQFARGRDGAQRAGGLAGVGGELELDRIQAVMRDA